MAEVGSPDDLHRMLGEADAVVCCAMYDGGNAGMFDTASFAAMRPGALFVNVARGALVDENALLDALESGRVGAAGLDVFVREPLSPEHPLARHPRVLATPHVGGLTDLMFERSATAFAGNVLRWAAGEPPLWTLNRPTAPRRP